MSFDNLANSRACNTLKISPELRSSKVSNSIRPI